MTSSTIQTLDDRAPTAPVAQVRAWIALSLMLGFILGFALGRAGDSSRAVAASTLAAEDQASALRMARDSLSEDLKFDHFLRAVAAKLPLGFQTWRRDSNGNLVLYVGDPAAWSALAPDVRQKVMELIGVGYTSFRIEMGLAVDLSRGHPVISLAGPDGTLLATRTQTGPVVVYR